jgi:hypothetical protein
MTLRALGVAAILLAFTTAATAGRVDWGDYLEKPGESRQYTKTTPEPKSTAAVESTKKAPTAKKATAKRVARPTKAKTSKAKSKRR